MVKLIFLFCLFVACAYLVSAQTMPDLRNELLQMLERDQAARVKCANGTTDEQIKCLVKIAEEIDAPNTKRMNDILASRGFPTPTLVGRDGVGAFVTMLQHVRDVETRKNSAVGMTRAYEDKVILPHQYAGFVDRLLIDQGKPQRYGSNFEMKDGKMVMTPVEDPRNLEKRRKDLGLPTMAEYMKMIKEMYKLEAVMSQSN